ncbi:hypothetical protein LTR49_028603 [Elasticomyces elasticus]|nr:hypothetical protein LTR49_028603 [Elasticomyces elasticus]KAK5740171.1 hypothetical protein LTS12_025048 [Elasticomyces elasticus]
MTRPGGITPMEALGKSSAVSLSTLIVAVAIPIVVLLLGFGILLWFIIKRGWLVRAVSTQGKYMSAASVKDPYEDHVAAQESKAWDRGAAINVPAQLDGQDVPHRAASAEIYQLHGDDNGKVNH